CMASITGSVRVGGATFLLILVKWKPKCNRFSNALSAKLAAVSSTPTHPVATTARSIAAYLHQLRAVVDRATASRQGWIRQIGSVTVATRTGDTTAAPLAGAIGRDQLVEFQRFREEVAALEPPAS